jgi:hypothetical protein
MLANALAAERLFDVDVPLVDVRALFADWPEHRGAIACAAIEAVRLGVASARGIAQALFDSVLMDEAVAAVGRVKAAHAFGSLERQSAQHVLTVLRPGFDALIAAGGDKVAWDLEPYVALAADIARWKLPEAVEMVLDAAVIDQRATNPYPGHPLRKIEDLVTSFHPEMPSDPSVPAFLAEAAGSWLDAHVGEPAAWDVYGDTAAAALDLGRSGAFTDPGNPLTVTLHQTVADPAQVTAVAENVWPGILRRLDDAPTRAIVKVLEAIERWLWIGADHDRPFGASHAPDRIDAARTGGRRLLADLRSLVAGHPGLAARYNNLAEQHGIDHGVQISEDIAPFFRNAELSLDWQAEQASIRAGIADVVEEWAAQPPDTICRRLVELRDQIEIAGLQWPPRIRVACDMLAENAPECLPWIEAALKEGLFPDANGMLREHRQRGGRFDVDMIGAAMTEPAARAAFAGAVLADLDAAPDELATVLGRLDGRDLNLFVSLGYTELPPERHRLLLTEPPPAARAAAAAAYAHRLSFDAGWSPGELAEPWLDALSGLPSLTNVASHDAQAILDYVATHDPECFVELLTPYLAELDRGERSAPMLPQFLSATRLLEPTHKTKLLAGIGRGARWLVLQHMIGPDPGWLAEAIDTGAISLDEALTACGGLGTRPSVQDLARVLVPLGADPERVAAVEMSGFWSGPRSDHFAQIAERFTAMSDSSDPSIAAVGSAGAQLFTRLADEARADEHRDRIRGYE